MRDTEGIECAPTKNQTGLVPVLFLVGDHGSTPATQLPVRQQVDLISHAQSNRHGCPAGVVHLCHSRGNPVRPHTQQGLYKLTMPCAGFIFGSQPRCDTCNAVAGSTTSRFDKPCVIKSLRLPRRHKRATRIE